DRGRRICRQCGVEDFGGRGQAGARRTERDLEVDDYAAGGRVSFAQCVFRFQEAARSHRVWRCSAARHKRCMHHHARIVEYECHQECGARGSGVCRGQGQRNDRARSGGVERGGSDVGKGKELADNYPVARQTFEEADEALGYKLSQVCFEGPEEKLKLTEITQPAILTVSIAAWRVLQEKGLKPDYVAGHSLGEYSAHVAAGTLAFADAVRTVRNRGQYMQKAVPVGVGAMAAILGMPANKVGGILTDAAEGEVCQAANINSPEQIVISGHAGAVERAIKLAHERGAKKAVNLPVSAPFHCSLMQPAQDRLALDLGALTFQNPSFPV